jgi:enoyl-[acyl-carrier protein] reductase I
MIDINRKTCALKRNVTIEDVGGSALYLLSDLSNAVTGEVHFADCGYSIIGLQDQPEQHKDEE